MMHLHEWWLASGDGEKTFVFVVLLAIAGFFR